MGCDIHLFIELQIGGKWEFYSNPDIIRNYALFGLIAGVRETTKSQIAPQRGLPIDISLMTRMHYNKWDSEAHSTTWLTYEDLCVVEKWVDKNDRYAKVQLGWLFGNTFEGWKKYPKDYPRAIENVRAVIWFDN